ncbi:MAG: serine hydrolase, partial [Bacteroidia bacterium]
IAQSIWVATWSNRDIAHYIEINKQVETLGIGGLIFFQGTAEKQAELINQYQAVTKVPLAVAMDCEWGAGMRLDNIVDFPYQMTLGAINDDSLIYRMGLEIGDQLRRLGITVNLAPVADINNNPLNPVINFRSFGEIKSEVAEKSVMYSKGLQEKGIMATAKHFPGHGDTDTDSHLDLPVLAHSRERFDTLELYPFRQLIENGVGAVMTAHLNIPSMGTATNLPSTLSPDVILGVLRHDLGFKGLVITDAMNMKGVTRYYLPGEADALAYLAGNDVIEYVDNPEISIKAIRKLLDESKITIDDVNMRCRRILAMKYWSGLSGFTPVKREGIEASVNQPSTLALVRELYSNALTLLTNDNMIPVSGLENKKIATLAVNSKATTKFQEMVGMYTDADHFTWNEGMPGEAELLTRLSGYDLIIAGIYNTDQRPYRNFGITDGLKKFIGEMPEEVNTITVYFGNPYAIERFGELEQSDALILAYQENSFTEELSAQLIFGAIGAHGKLPVTINERFRSGYGLITPGNLRLQYGYPESAGVSSGILEHSIDSIALAGIEAGAYPGCEVLAARNGIVIFSKSYGYHTFDKREKTEAGDLWDLASVTKVSAALAGLMKLDDMGQFSTGETISTYWPDLKHSDKGDLRMDEILAHQAGLMAWIPYWKNTVRDNGKYKARTIRYEPSERYPIVVSQGLYLNENYRKKIYREIKKSPLGEKKYLYSGLTFFLYPQIIENLSGMKYEEFLDEKIYHRLGAYNIVFNPYRLYSLSRIVPTELDTLFRHQLLHGYVHDEGSAMMGGLSGNAGLFATGNDLLKLVEMYRRMGNYGGEQVIAEEVVRKYSTAPFLENDNRRGLGFDKPQTPEMVQDIKDIYPCPGASPSSFGHSGYTGTFIWADPEKGISYVFMSNRVYPTRDNNLISDMNIRTLILQAIYDSIL